MKRPKPPCKGCEERRPGCHTECDGYKTFRADLDAFNKIIKEAEDRERDLDQFDYDQKRKRR